jgi:hypothetical protein
LGPTAWVGGKGKRRPRYELMVMVVVVVVVVVVLVIVVAATRSHSTTTNTSPMDELCSLVKDLVPYVEISPREPGRRLVSAQKENPPPHSRSRGAAVPVG